MVIRYKTMFLSTLLALSIGSLGARNPEGSCRSPLESLSTAEKIVVTGSMGTVNAIMGTPFQHMKNALQNGYPRPELKHLWRGTGLNIIRSTPSTLPEVLIMGNADRIIKQFQLPIACDTQKAGLAFAASTPGTVLNTLAEQLVMRKKNGNTCYSIIKDTLKNHSPMVFFRGFTPKLLRDGTGSCAYWYAAPKLKELYKERGLGEPLATIGAGLSVAIPSSILTHPFDTTSTAMANDLGKKTYRHTLQTIRDYTRLHGFAGLFRGVTPRTVSAAIRIPTLIGIQDFLTSTMNNQKNKAKSL